MHPIIKSLEERGIPVFWQLIVSILLVNSLSFPFLYENQDLLHVLKSISGMVFIAALFAAYKSQANLKTPMLVLIIGVVFATIGVVIKNLIHFKIGIPPSVSVFFQESGVLFFMLFAYLNILMFERKFNLKGFTIDFLLLTISALFLFLIISPNLLSALLHSFDSYQQMQAFNLVLGIIVLTSTFLHFLFTKSLGLTDILRMSMSALLVLHFALELLSSFEQGDSAIFMKTFSQGVFNSSGVLAVLFIFIEKFSLDFSSRSPNRVSNLFMWVSSIFAIIAIPIGLIIRSTIDAPPLDLFLIGATSILTSTIVIWRLIVLIKNSNQQKERLNTLIMSNGLTGLPNFRGYLERLQFSNLKNVLAIHINIEDFKSINDLYGRDVGDLVLKNLSNKLKQISNTLIAAHIESDQFLVAIKTEESDIKNIINKLQNDLGASDIFEGKTIAVPLTFGASFNENFDPEKLAKQAESALKKARANHSSFELYSKEKTQNKIPRNEIRQILQKAVDDNYLPVHFQPIYNLTDGSIKALELLIRVDSEEHGLLLHWQFLEQAKSSSLLTSLTQVCIKMIAENRQNIGDITVNVNLPPYILKSPKLLNKFINAFKDENLEPSNFCIEITEDEDISAHDLIPSIQTLKNEGFSVAMDDFGTGYSSLDRLSILQVDTVKIDRSILLTSETGNTTILEWSISLAKKIGVSVVVEGVETLEQLSLVKLLGADSVQGFLYSKPVSAMQLENIAMNSNDIKVS